MPLRDHFRPPVSTRHHWSTLHGQWPGEIVRTLFDILPAGYEAGPRLYLGSSFEADEPVKWSREPEADRPDAGADTLAPTLAVETDLNDQDEYEVRVYDAEAGRTLVAAVEIVSPSNKDRPDSRDQFAGKVAALLREGVSVTVVELVTDRRANRYATLLARFERSDPALGAVPPSLYAVTLRWDRLIGGTGRRARLDSWFHPMAVGEPLPTVPLWLSPDLRIELPLEPSYQEACRRLHIP